MIGWNTPNYNAMLALIFLATSLMVFDFSRHYKHLKSVDFWFWMSLDLLQMISFVIYYMTISKHFTRDENDIIETRAGSYGCMVLIGFLRCLRILLNFAIGR